MRRVTRRVADQDGESARDNHVLACNFAKYLPILFFYTDSAIDEIDLS